MKAFPVLHKSVQNHRLTAVNRLVNWAFNRSGYRIRPRLFFVIFSPFKLNKFFFNLRKLSEFESKSGLLIFVSVLKPLVLDTSPNFA